MILADPGMGKSTLLRMEAGKLAREEKKNLSGVDSKNLGEKDIATIIASIQIPLYLRLSDLAEESGNIADIILKFIKRDYPSSAEKIEFLLREKLEKGQCLLLLDALDEVSSKKRERLKPYLNPFIKDFANKTICTSRIVGYTEFLEDAKEMEIVPFTEKQTEEYIEYWFENAKKEKVLEDESVSATGLVNEIRTKPQIQGLTQNPLLLSLVCSLYQTKGLELPARKTQVYEQAVDMMLSKWKIEAGADLNDRNAELIEDNRKRSRKRLIYKSLQAIAYYFSCQQKEVFTGDELYDQLSEYLGNEDQADDLLEKLTEDYGIIQKLSEKGDQYLFLHRTFQEYLTASYIHEKIQENQEEGIALVKEHLWHFNWHETISLVAGLMDNDPIPLLEAITQEQDDIFNTLLLLAGLCLSECPNINHPLVTEIVDKIIQFSQKYPNANFISRTLVELGKISNENAIEHFIKAFDDYNYETRSTAALALGDIGNERVVKFLTTCLENYDFDRSSLAIQALSKIANNKAVQVLSTALFNKFFGNIESSEEARLITSKVIQALGKIANNKPVQVLITAVENDDPFLRYETIYTLGEIGNEKAVKSLINALDDFSECGKMPVLDESCDDDFSKYLRSHVAIALGKICRKNRKNGKAVEALIKALDDSEEPLDIHRVIHKSVRGSVVFALGEIGNKKAVSHLIQTLNNSSEDVRTKVAEALAKIGGEKAIVALFQLIDDSNKEVSRIAQSTFIKYCKNNIEGEEFLIESLDDSDEYIGVRVFFAFVLGELRNKKAIVPLIKILNDTSENKVLRQEIAKVLGKIGDEKAIVPLINILNNSSEDEDMRSKAAEVLGKIDIDKIDIGNALETLIKILNDTHEDIDLKQKIIRVLAKVADNKAVAPLINILNNSTEHFEVRREAVFALGKIRNNKAVETLIKTLNDTNEHIILREEAVFALSRIGSDQVVEPLLKYIIEQDQTGRMYIRNPKDFAIEALGEISNDKALKALIKILNDDSDTSNRKNAIEALGKISNDKALKAIIKVLDNDNGNVDVKRQAIYTLGKIGNDKNDKVVTQMIKTFNKSNENENVRRDAANALGKIGKEKAVIPLIEALNEKNYSVRNSVVCALEEINSLEIVTKLLEKTGSRYLSSRYFSLSQKINGSSQSRVNPSPYQEVISSAIRREN